MPGPAAVDFDRMTTLGDVARYHRQERPEATALEFEGRATTFAAFDRHTDRVAAALLAEGLNKGDRIAYVGKNSDHYFELLFGAAKVGVVLAPIGWRLAPREIAYILGDAEAKVVFVGPELLAHVRDVAVLMLDQPVVIAMEANDYGHPTFEAWRDGAAARDLSEVSVNPADIAIQLYTSGTTDRIWAHC